MPVGNLVSFNAMAATVTARMPMMIAVLNPRAINTPVISKPPNASNTGLEIMWPSVTNVFGEATMISAFFINRPVLANVLAIVIVLIVAINLVGDRIRDQVNPRLKR